jgi:hypothetical protein
MLRSNYRSHRVRTNNQSACFTSIRSFEFLSFSIISGNHPSNISANINILLCKATIYITIFLGLVSLKIKSILLTRAIFIINNCSFEFHISLDLI